MSAGQRVRAAWSDWSGAHELGPYTLGVEEEAMLLDPRTWALAHRIDDLLPRLSVDAQNHVSAETHGSAFEVQTNVRRTVGEFAQPLRQAARRGHRRMEDARNGLRMLRFLFHSFRPRTAPHFPCGNCAGMVLTPGERCGPASDCRFTNGAIREYPASIHK